MKKLLSRKKNQRKGRKKELNFVSQKRKQEKNNKSKEVKKRKMT